MPCYGYRFRTKRYRGKRWVYPVRSRSRSTLRQFRIPAAVKPRNLMNTRSTKELTYGHAILHRWARNSFARKPANWSEAQIREEHARLLGIARERHLPMGRRHRTPL